MKSILTELYVLRQGGKVRFASTQPISAADWHGHDWRPPLEQATPPPEGNLPLIVEIERRDIPLLPAELVLWNIDDGESNSLAPHLHYTCPRCLQMQNSDLYPNDPNPRFACCDSCRWDSILWLSWEPGSLDPVLK